jgi:hypothetical protein
MKNVYWPSCIVHVILSDFNETRQCFEKYSNIKFHENSSGGNQGVPCGQADGETDGRAEGRTDMTKLAVAVRNFANAPIKEHIVAVFAAHCLSQDRRGR